MSYKILILIIVGAIIILGLILFFVVGGGDVSRTPIISRFFPESEEIEIQFPPEEKEERIIIREAEEKKAFSQLSDKPIVGAAFASSTNKVRYLEKASGHLFEIEQDGQNRKRISNTTILNIFNAVWSDDGADKAIVRFVKEGVINNFAANFTGSSTIGTFLPKNLKSAAISPKGTEVAYMEEIGGRGVVFTSDFENKNKKQIFSAPLSDFIIFWQDTDNLSLLTKPSALSNSFFYSLNIKNKSLEKLQEGFGLNVLWSPNGKKLLVAKNIDNALENKILSLKDNKEYNLSVKTFPEKCVWSKLNKEIIYCAVPITIPPGEYPDDWYQGKISFKDAILKINYLTGENNIADGQIPDLDFDAINLFLNPDENYIFFINKKGSILWSVQMKN